MLLFPRVSRLRIFRGGMAAVFSQDRFQADLVVFRHLNALQQPLGIHKGGIVLLGFLFICHSGSLYDGNQASRCRTAS